MTPLLVGLTVAGAAAALVTGALSLLALLRVPHLPPLPDGSAAAPSVTIVAAARDEADHVEVAVRSWLRQAGASVVVVNDRSRDATGAILDALAETEPRLQVVHLTSRPPDWLGKCHALREGAARATSDFLLFTDADVVLAPDAVRRAAAAAARGEADVFVVIPEVATDTLLQWVITHHFFHGFLPALGGHRANRDDGRCLVGVGAFNLVRRSAYEAVGGHEEIRLQVGDDVALARLIVRAGGRHRVYEGADAASVHWQRGGVGATLRGLEKNAFWGVRLSVPLLLAFTAAHLVLLAPLVTAPLLGGWGWAALATWATGQALPWLAPTGPWPRRLLGAALSPLATVLLAAAVWRSALVTLTRGGITWRDDFFPLAQLRSAQKPASWWFGRRA